MIQRVMISCFLAVSAICATILGMWVQDRDLPVQSRIVEVVGPAYPGGKLFVRWQVFRAESCEGAKQEIILDVRGVRWIMPEFTAKTSPGPMGFDSFVSQTDLPDDIPIGDGLLRVNLRFVCNPVHRFWPVVNRIPDFPIVISPRPVALMN